MPFPQPTIIPAFVVVFDKQSRERNCLKVPNTSVTLMMVSKEIQKNPFCAFLLLIELTKTRLLKSRDGG